MACSKCNELEKTHDVLIRKLQILANDNSNLQNHCVKTEKTIEQIRNEQEKYVKEFSLNLDQMTHNKSSLSSIDLIRVMHEQLNKFYKCSFIPDFDQRYGSNISTKIESLINKLEKANENTEKPIFDPKILINEFNDFKIKTMNLKVKINQQKKLIQNIVNLNSCQKIDSSSSSPFTSVSSSSNNTTIGSADTSGLGDNLCINQDDLYTCPLCLTSIEACKITQKKFDNHVRKCDPSKVCCMFCLKLYDKTEHILLENHVQKHIIKQNLTKSPTTTVSIVKKLNSERILNETTSSDLGNKSASSSGNSSFVLNDAILDQSEDTQGYMNYSAVRQYLKLNDSQN